MTLLEFLEIGKHEHFRIYQPNRDCLIYESYREVHSPYYFDDEHEEKRDFFNSQYFSNNGYCDNIYQYPDKVDEETKVFLKKYGNYEVFRVEIGSFRPEIIYTDENDQVHLEAVQDPRRPDSDYLDCFNIFIG